MKPKIITGSYFILDYSIVFIFIPLEIWMNFSLFDLLLKGSIAF
jgi:hypothetical protein